MNIQEDINRVSGLIAGYESELDALIDEQRFVEDNIERLYEEYDQLINQRDGAA